MSIADLGPDFNPTRGFASNSCKLPQSNFSPQALRVGKQIEWDASNLRAKHAPEAGQFIHGQYRKGWEV